MSEQEPNLLAVISLEERRFEQTGPHGLRDGARRGDPF